LLEGRHRRIFSEARQEKTIRNILAAFGMSLFSEFGGGPVPSVMLSAAKDLSIQDPPAKARIYRKP